MGLFAAITSKLIQKQCRAMVATHFHEVFDHGLNLDFIESISFYTLDIQFENEITYLYRLVKGRCTKSLGIQCASQAGFPIQLIERALAISNSINNAEPIPTKSTTKNSDVYNVLFKLFVEMVLTTDIDIEQELFSKLRSLI